MAMPPALAGVNRLRNDWPNITAVVRSRARWDVTAPSRLIAPVT